MIEAQENAIVSRITHARAAVAAVVEHAERPLSVAEVRLMARRRFPNLGSLTLASALADLRREGLIALAD
jgi:Fe2+ or Zn2+ uptake regulation protein